MGTDWADAMLEIIASIAAAFIASNVGAAEFLVGILVATGFVACAMQGREGEHPEVRQH